MVDEPTSRGPLSAFLHWLDWLTSRAAVALIMAVVALWIAAAFVLGLFPVRWERHFWTIAASVTLAMVFIIQHTQTRHQKATQVKLDELVKNAPGADSRVVKVETASDDELHEAHRRQLRHRASTSSDAD